MFWQQSHNYFVLHSVKFNNLHFVVVYNSIVYGLLILLGGKYPVFIVGDFNTCTGHKAYNMMISKEGGFTDTWTQCELSNNTSNNSNKLCTTTPNHMSSYHHYLGPRVGGYAWWLPLYVAYTYHSRGTTPTWGRYLFALLAGLCIGSSAQQVHNKSTSVEQILVSICSPR